jgi:hypothetical protein
MKITDMNMYSSGMCVQRSHTTRLRIRDVMSQRSCTRYLIWHSAHVGLRTHASLHMRTGTKALIISVGLSNLRFRRLGHKDLKILWWANVCFYIPHSSRLLYVEASHCKMKASEEKCSARLRRSCLLVTQFRIRRDKKGSKTTKGSK